MDYYEILGVATNSSAIEIKNAYKKLALKYHPDKNPGGSDEFAKVNEAYSTLGDIDKRREYDLGTSFQRDFSRFKDFYNSNSQSVDKPIPKKGEDIVLNLSITVNDIIKNNSKKIKYDRRVLCNLCGGSGASKYKKCTCVDGCELCNYSTLLVDVHCVKCSGKKHSVKNQELTIDITSDVRNGSSIIKKGFGHSSDDMGPNGDLICIFKLNDDSIRINGDDIIIEEDFLPHDLVLGGPYTIRFMGKEIVIDIPKYSDSSKHILVKGHGLGDNGNLYIKINCVSPKIPTEDEIKLYQKIKDLYQGIDKI